MRESLGGSMLLNLVLIFAGLVIILFVGILSYSKAYKVKNRIVEIIEKYGAYEKIDSSTNTNVVTNEINENLKTAGYETSLSKKCNTIRNRLVNEKYNGELSQNLNQSYGYNYCVFEMNKSENSTGKYYVVVTFIHFQVPIIGDVLTFPIYGETKILNKTYDY
jgi:hypothetical protein